MRPLARQVAASAMDAEILRGADGPAIEAVFTDTRAPIEGGLFVALSGERFDGHRFVSSAIEAGAGGLVISDAGAAAGAPEDLFVALVDDTRLALGRLAAKVRADAKARVVAITGSSGKTTVKEMTAAALSAFGSVAQTPGNFNNEIGLPLTLFGFEGDEDFFVLELGMSAPGEIAYLTSIADPDVGLVTGVSAAHLEFFESVEGIADAKAELYAGLGSEGVAIAYADDARTLSRARRLKPEGLITYGRALDATVRLVRDAHSREGLVADIDAAGIPCQVRLPALGAHNAINAAGALAVAVSFGLDPAAAAKSLSARFRPVKHRLIVVPARGGLTVLDDCYNANPASTRAALETLAEVAGDAPPRMKGAVLGSMLELGPTADDLHREIGQAAVTLGVGWLAVLGPHAEALAEGARCAGLDDASLIVAEDAAELSDAVREFAAEGRWLLLKGSRGGRLERLLDVLAPSDAEGVT